MRFIRFARDIKDIKGTYRDLAAEAARADDEASYKLTVMARGFARRSRRVVDDKLSFSATLMRAGEVAGANRLLDEVQTEVRSEEAALMEKVNEARVAQAVRKDKMTRLRLVRMVAVAIMGSMLMGLSAAGFAAVSYLDARQRDAARNAQGSLKVASVERELTAHKVAKRLARLAGSKDKGVADILMKMSMSDLRELDKMTAEGVGPLELQQFLVAALPSAELAQKLADTLVGVASGTPVAAPRTVKKAVDDPTSLIAAARKRAKAAAPAKEDAPEEETQPSSEPSNEPSPDDQPTNDDKDPPEEDPGPTLPPNGPFDGQNSSGKDGDGGLLD